MLTIKRQPSGEKLVVRLGGTIEEDLDLSEVIGPVPSDVTFSCKEIQRINSAGVRIWIKYFDKLTHQGTRVTFIELSPAVVEQLNLISNFCCSAKIESVYVPYTCNTCRTQFVSLFSTEELKRIYKTLPQPDCPKCKSKTMFDDIEDEYFGFLVKVASSEKA